MKLLLYCTKAKPYLINRPDKKVAYKLMPDPNQFKKEFPVIYNALKDGCLLNGKIVAECDYEVHKIIHTDITDDDFSYGYYDDGKNVRICKDSCLTKDEIFDYLYNGYVDKGYAIHIKNLHIFDEPKSLKNYYKMPKEFDDCEEYIYLYNKDGLVRALLPVEKAPQNMMYVFDGEEKKVLISIRPEWLCKILNGEKKIEVRKKVLKEML